MTVIHRLRQAGIRRVGSPSSGFRYRSASTAPVSPEDLARIRALVLPPGWTDVFISPFPRSTVQAIGRDRAGRWQYRYSPRQVAVRERKKREKLIALLKVLPDLRARVSRDLATPGLSRERVLAGMVRILLKAFMRPGSQAYARDNGTFGIATLRPRHVRVERHSVEFAYPGKGGKRQLRRIEDREVARLVRSLLRDPGRELFRYRGEGGEWVDVRRRHINEYLREITGDGFTAKDFRTWAGTLFGACALARAGYPTPVSARALRSRIAAAMRETAALLGNTPAVCRTSYVCPRVVESFERGRILSVAVPTERLVRASGRSLALLERRVAALLRDGATPNGRNHRTARA